MARCEAWVGLAPPDETADCELDLGHDGVHEGTLNGSVRDRTGAYRYVPQNYGDKRGTGTG